MTGEESYIAVVHADGNDMSGFIKNIAQTSTHNRDYIERMRGFAHQIEQSGEAALVHTLLRMRQAIYGWARSGG